MRATRAIIHLENFTRNFRAVREKIGLRRKICVPVKANAYGHGAAHIARIALENGAFCLAVATVDEGAELRQGGISAPILLFSQFLPEEAPDVIKNSLIPFVSDDKTIDILACTAKKAGMRLPVHLKVDTGMGRMGCFPADAPVLARKIAAYSSLEYAGTATHLAAADSTLPEDTAYTGRQLDRFREALDGIRAAGLDPGIVHAANSGAVLLHPDAWFDMVRPGILLYGYAPADSPLRPLPVMELRTKAAFIKTVKKGEPLSYGRTWTAPQDTSIAVLPAGYADGLPRSVGGKWQAVINGKMYPLVGRICMDQCMADIGTAAEVRRWDDAVLFGGPAPDAAALAAITGTIPYEITCNISGRVPRVYCNDEPV
jgi:alanine racemase